MNFLKTIKEKNLIDDSLLPIVFNDLLDDEDYWFSPEYDLPRLAKSISLFYFGLIQSYCFAKAQNETKKLKELAFKESIIDPVANVWNVDMPGRFNSLGELFSFFIFAGNQNTDTSVFLPDFKNQILEVKKAYESINSSSRISLQVLSREQFIAFLKSLPLLRTTSFDKKTMKFVFSTEEKKISIKASPFISFLNFDSSPLGEPVESLTENCYVLTSVSKGQKNDELFFDTLCIDSTDFERDRKRICRQITSNENLRLLCQTANIETRWYPIDDCWCDLKFLNKMVDASEKVLFKCCKIENLDFQGEENIKEKILNILQDTELYATLCSLEEIRACDLNEILFNLFLSEGLFRSVKSIIFNPRKKEELSNKRMFNLYLNELIVSKTIAPETAQEYIAKCENKINSALKKLAHIVAENTTAYQNRKREIDAEWKAYYVLKAAGIKTNSLFADVETILSIDDYYDMLLNSEASPEYDMMQLLRMLCVFYEALLENGSTFNEAKFFLDAERIAPEYNLTNHTLDSLFSSFAQIAKKSEKSPEMFELLGRSGIGVESYKYIEFIRNRVLNPQHSTIPDNHGNSGFAEHAVFISYAHEDIDIVKPIVDRWRSLGIDLFFDDTDIHHGENWQEIAEQCIKSDKCKMFIFFSSENSVCKQGVVKELRFAYNRKVKPKDKTKVIDGFIIPINIVKNTNSIKDYLPEMTTNPEDKDARNCASEILDKKYIELETSCINYHKLTPEELDKNILRDYERMTDNDGRVIAPFRYDNFKLNAANFYAFLKYGEGKTKSENDIHDYFNDKNISQAKCIYPIVASIKEARIKRDNIAIVGYELIRGKGRQTESSHILTSKALDVDDYYCIPKYRNSENPGKYMIEPLLIKCDRFLEILSKSRGNDND